MLTSTIQKLQRFVGCVCSIISIAINRSFDEAVAREHFVIRVNEINVDGIWGSHPYNPDLISFFSFPHIISIHEEVELSPDNPEHQKMIQEYEERTGKKIRGDLHGITQSEPSQDTQEGQAVFVDIEGLEKLAAKTKKTFDAYNRSID